MVGAIVKCDLHIDNLVACKHTGLHCALNTCIHCRNIFLRNCSADHFVDKFITLAGFVGLNDQFNVTILALTAGLTGIFGFLLNSLANLFLVGNLRCTDIRLYLEFTQQSVNDNFQVKLAHTSNDRLTGLIIGIGFEGRILFCELCKRNAHFLLASSAVCFSVIHNIFGNHLGNT